MVSGLAAATEALAGRLTQGRKGLEGCPEQGLPEGRRLHLTDPSFRSLDFPIFQVLQSKTIAEFKEDRNEV